MEDLLSDIQCGNVEKVKEVFNNQNEQTIDFFASYYRDLFFYVNERMIRTLLEYPSFRNHCLEMEHPTFLETPLIHSIKIADWNTVITLVECGADVNHTITNYNYIDSPLSNLVCEISYCEKNNNDPITDLEKNALECLLRSGANPNQQLRVNLQDNIALYTTPFTKAIYYLNPDLIRLFISYGAKIDCTRYGKYNIFNYAMDSELRKAEKLKLLLSNSDKECFDDLLITQVLRKQNYALIELVLAYAKKFNIDIKSTMIPQTICKSCNINIAKLLFVVYPGCLNCDIKIKYEPKLITRCGYLSFRDYTFISGNLELLELLDDNLPTLFNILSIHLHFIEKILDEPQNS